MPNKRNHTWLAVILFAVGLLLIGIPSLWVYMSATATLLHPDPRDIPSSTQSNPLPKWAAAVEQARQMITSNLTERNLPGLSVAVGIGPVLVWAESFGFADLDNRVALTPNHRFRIGTASTVLTSAAAGLLLQQDRLKLDDRIQGYVPAFPEKQWPVTLRQLMGHVAGVPNDGGDEGPLLSEHCERPVDALQHFAQSRLLFEPGTRYRYSSYGWILVSAAIEAVAKQPFLTFMREQIFDRLGMRDTISDSATADSATNPIPDRVSLYFPRFAADPTYGLHPMRPLDYSCYAGSSQFLSTPSDMVRFGVALNNGKLLQPSTVQLLHTSQRLISGKETGHGLGWDIETAQFAGETSAVIGHDGKVLGGSMASLVIIPKYGIVVSVASNISYAGTFSLALRIAQPFAGLANTSTP